MIETRDNGAGEMAAGSEGQSCVRRSLRAVRRSGVLDRVRCWLLPPRNSVFVGGAWRRVVPVLRGPAVAMLGERPVAAWWLLGCGRIAEFVGIHDERPMLDGTPPIGRGEILIDGIAVYRVSAEILDDAGTYACFQTGHAVRPDTITVRH